MWNDTDNPLAYLITFRSYGTWLHGDERGSIDRLHNSYRSPYIEPNQNWHRHNVQILEGEPVVLDESRRRSVDHAIRETCTLRKLTCSQCQDQSRSCRGRNRTNSA